MRAVRFSRYGGPEVLEVVDVPRPVPGDGQALVRVVAADINPGEARIREGEFHEMWPATFPEGQGNTLAGVVEAVGSGVEGFAVGDRVVGAASRSTHAEYVVVDRAGLFPAPDGLDWDEAATITSIGATAWATVHAIAPVAGETIVVSGAGGGVGHLAAQLAAARGARVIGVAGEHDAAYLRSIGVVPVAYGDGLPGRLRDVAPDGIAAWIDTYGHGNVALAVELGVPADRIDTINDADAAARFGTHADGHAAGMTAEAVDEVASLLSTGRVTVRMRERLPLERVQDAYRLLESPGAPGKIVLRIGEP